MISIAAAFESVNSNHTKTDLRAHTFFRLNGINLTALHRQTKREIFHLIDKRKIQFSIIFLSEKTFYVYSIAAELCVYLLKVLMKRRI